MGIALDQAASMRAHNDISGALRSLRNQSLMGESTYNSMGFGALMDGTGSGIILTQASLRDDNRYQALAAHSEQGQTLADYQQQRVEERRESVDQYLNAFYALARDYAHEVDPSYNGNFSEGRTSLSQLIEDPDTGQPLSGNEHRITDNAVDREQALAFMDKHNYELSRVRQLYRELKETPDSLEGWLQKNNIDVDATMDKALDDTRYSGSSAGDSRLDVLKSHTRAIGATAEGGFTAENGDLQLSSQQPMSRANQRDLWLAQRLDNRSTSIKLANGEANGYQIYFSESMPERVQQRDNRIAEMQSIQRALGSDIDQRFQLENSAEHFSLQDIVSNLIAGRPIATRSNGTQHPKAAEIEQFYQQHQTRIDRYQNLAQLNDEHTTKGGMQLIGTYSRYSTEVIRENIEARLQTESKEEILASIDNPRLKRQVQRYFDTDGYAGIRGHLDLGRGAGGGLTGRSPTDFQPPAEMLSRAEETPLPEEFLRDRVRSNDSSLIDSIKDPLLKLAFRYFTENSGNRSDA